MFMTDITLDLDKVIPPTLTVSRTFAFLFAFSAVVLLVTLLARLILGRDSSLKHAMSSSLGILVLYGMVAMIFTFNPAGLRDYLAPLPFVTLNDGYMDLFQFSTADFPTICVQLLSMLVLAYLINQINSVTPDKMKALGWFAYRLMCVFFSIFVHYVVYRVFNRLADAYMTEKIAEYAPMILLFILVFFFSLGLIKFILGLFLTAVNPVFGGIYAFFFANKIGKNISRAIGSTAILTGFICFLQYLGFHTFPIAPDALGQYIPFTVCVGLLWFLVGAKL